MLLIILIAVLTQLTGHGAQACNITIDQVTVQEGTNDTCVRLSEADDVSTVYYDRPKAPPFMDVVNGSLCMNDTLTLDDNQEWCDFLEKNNEWALFVKCDNDATQHRINVVINYTDDFPPHFTTNLSASVDEMEALQTPVLSIKRDSLNDADCNNNLQLGVNTIFSIEGGNTGQAFELTNSRSGVLAVKRWLDYENNDRHFFLNLSVADKDRPDRKSYTTVEVTVKDIDDNAPVFADHSYRLHVPEQDNSSVGVWLVTEPPVSVLDPDQDVEKPEGLIVSLYNASDGTKVKVNDSGAVQLQTTFDREEMSEFTVVLKVQQDVSTWMSSTVTLTVIIDDVNDNRPLFDPSVYHFTLPEHSPALTSVGLLFAKDRDEGDNAVFNYTLLSHGALFTMETYGGGSFGVLRVLNSTLLDREDSPELLVKVGTQELRAEEGGDCSGGYCEVTVKVTLLDINDHSPVFGQSSYNATKLDYVAHDVIITISATDDDSGDNGHVVYAVRSLPGPGVCADVTINATSGDVSVGQSVTRAVTCLVLVDACDSPAVSQTRRCTSVVLQVSLLVSNHTVVLQTSVSPDLLIPQTLEIQRQLSDILGVTVNVVNIAPNSAKNGSEVMVTATNSSTQDPVSREQLQQLTTDHATEIEALFLSFLPDSTTTTTTTTTTTPATTTTNTTTTPTPSTTPSNTFPATTTPLSNSTATNTATNTTINTTINTTADPGSSGQGDEDDNDFPPHVIALIAVAACLLLLLIGALIVIFLANRRYKRQKRLTQRLSTDHGAFFSAELAKGDNNNDNDYSSTTTTPTLPLVEEGRGGEGVTNPIYQEDEDRDPLPRFTPRSSSGEDMGEEEGERVVESQVPVTRFPDADSGVPSDRENGGGEDGSPTTSSPSFSSRGPGGGSTGGPAGSAYLSAVLQGLLSSSAGDGVGDDVAAGTGEDDVNDMIDVTSLPVLYAAGKEEEGVDGGGSAELSSLGAASAGVEEEDVDAVREGAAADIAMATCSEETGEMMNNNPSSPSSSDVDTGRLLGALLHQHFLASNRGRGEEEEEGEEEDEDEEGDESFRSSLGRMVRASTPPMHRSHAGEEEDDDEEMPEEPPPDYAKKVRFSMQVTEMPQLGDPHISDPRSDDDVAPPEDETLRDDVSRPADTTSDQAGEAGVVGTTGVEGGGGGADSDISTLLIRPLGEVAKGKGEGEDEPSAPPPPPSLSPLVEHHGDRKYVTTLRIGGGDSH
ncbi:uncharacterized protein LOC143282837 [Babylonia areolata]|uniref:uncharacterized protein LOC143282837 n=1 Tax=Babylonia areolata TaxID=304850 RepID=UPI003FCF858B